MTLVVYTALTGEPGDVLRPPLAPPPLAGRPVQYVCFSDRHRACAGWNVRPPVWEHPTDPRRTARYHKLQAHRLFPDAAFTLWHDGTHQLKVDPWELVDAWMPAGIDMATFRHSQRRCLYVEADACIRLRKDNRQVLEAQIARYLAARHPMYAGLFETGVLLRRAGACDELNDAWWHELAVGSRRDQVSLPYVVHCMNLWPRVALFDGDVRRNPYFRFHPHR